MLTVPGAGPALPQGNSTTSGLGMNAIPRGISAMSACSVSSINSNLSALSGLKLIRNDQRDRRKQKHGMKLDSPTAHKKKLSTLSDRSEVGLPVVPPVQTVPVNFGAQLSTKSKGSSDSRSGMNAMVFANRGGSRSNSKESSGSRRAAETDTGNDFLTRMANDEPINPHEVAGYSAKVPMRRSSFIGLMTQPEDEGKLAQLQWRVRLVLASQRFDWLIGAIIFINSLTIGIQATYELEGRNVSAFDDAEHAFIAIYSAELAMRFFSMGRACLRSGWVLFDVVLVGMGVIQTWIVEPIVTTMVINDDSTAKDGLDALMVLRIMRLLRLARSVRLLVQFKTLWMLVRGLLTSASTMFYTFMLIVIILYVFSCLGVELITKSTDLNEHPELGGIVAEYFSGVAVTMLTLFRFVTLDDAAEIYTPLIQFSPWILGAYFMIFIIVVSVSLMNLVTAVIVEGAIEQGKQDREVQKAYEKQKVSQLIPTIRRLFEELDTDGSGGVSLEEVTEADETVQLELQKIMQTDQLVVLFELLDTDGSGDISIDEFCDGIAKMVTSEEPMEFIRIRKQMQQNRIETEAMGEKVVHLDTSLQEMKDSISGTTDLANDFVSDQSTHLTNLESFAKEITGSIQLLTDHIATVQKTTSDLAADQNLRIVHLEKAAKRMDATLEEVASHILGRPPLSIISPGSDDAPMPPDTAGLVSLIPQGLGATEPLDGETDPVMLRETAPLHGNPKEDDEEGLEEV